MRRLRIGPRIYSIIALGGIGLAVGTVMFIGLLLHVGQRLAILQTQMQQHDQARVMQVDFKKQVQEWKNVLLRGHGPEDLDKYHAAFVQQSLTVRTNAEVLKRTVRDAETRELISRFLDEHQTMGRKYQAALDRFTAGTYDARAADAMVRGQDRAPTDLIDQIVAKIGVLADVEAEVAEIRSQAVATGAAMAGLLVLLIVGGGVVARSITRPLAETIVGLERVAAGDLQYRMASEGHDEVARMNRALNATVEAIQRTHERLSILHEIDTAILALHSPAIVAETALRHLRRLVQAPRATLTLYDLAAGTAQWLAVEVEGHTELTAGQHLSLEMMGNLRALRQGEIQIVEASSVSHLAEGQAAAAEGIQSYAVVPLIAEGRLIGSLNLGARSSGGPSPADLTAAREIASQLAIALHQSRIHQEMWESRDRLSAVIDSSPLAIITINTAGLVQSWNPAATKLFEWTADEVLGQPLPIVPEGERAAYSTLLASYRRGEAVSGLEAKRRRKDGSLVDVVISVAPISDAHGRSVGAIGVIADVTERKQLGQQLVQAQKMDAIGQLAGGVAHDFNNLLTVIGGRSTLLLQRMGAEEPARKHVELIYQAGQRAAELTRQLLAFSRKQILTPKPIDLNVLVAGVTPMLRRLIGENIEIVTVAGDDLGHVMADPGQIEQVIMNLVVNARDAMSDGGMVKIETSIRQVNKTDVKAHSHVPPGCYVTLSVQDTGCGMDSVTVARIFEPFFTTKASGHGTGLGLSTVHGIVHQSAGYIAVDSALGRGTTFTVYLPRTKDAVSVPDDVGKPAENLLRGTETVLLVEDDAGVRELASEVLRSCGYKVLETGDPLEALSIGERHTGAIKMLLTDMVMPAMGGSEVASRIEAMCPGVRTLYMSGYTEKIAAEAASHARAFLPKPFSPHDLAKKVRETLAGEQV